MGNSICLGGGIKSAYCGGNVKEIYLGTYKLFPSGADKIVIDGLEYRTAKMPDGRIWMCENLQVNVPNSRFYDDDEATYGRNGKNYGRLYFWDAAMGISVPGWHLPTYTEWYDLVAAVGPYSAGTELKSTKDWSVGYGTDNYGFSVLPAGYWAGGSVTGSFYNVGNLTCFWMATESSSNYAYSCCFSRDPAISESRKEKTYFAYSVRLVKDA